MVFRLVAILFFTSYFTSVHAQLFTDWQMDFPNPVGKGQVSPMCVDDDGNCYLIGGWGCAMGALYKFDNAGHLLWKVDSMKTATNQDGIGLWINNNRLYHTGCDVIECFDLNGNLLWKKSPQDYPNNIIGSFMYYEAKFDSQGNFLFSNAWDNGSGIQYEQPGICKFDSVGNLLWSRFFPIPSTTYMNTLSYLMPAFLDNNGNIVLTYREHVIDSAYQSTYYQWIHFLNKDGVQIWQKRISSTTFPGAVYQFATDKAGKLYGLFWPPGRLDEFDSTGNIIKTTNYVYPSQANRLFITDDDRIILGLTPGGAYSYYSNEYKQLALNGHPLQTFLYDTSGYISTFKKSGNGFYALGHKNFLYHLNVDVIKLDTSFNSNTTVHFEDYTRDINFPRLGVSNNKEVYVAFGSDADTSLGNPNADSITVIKLCPDCRPNVLGKCFRDINTSCVQDSLETDIQYRLVRRMPGNKYTFTDKNGVFSFRLSNGDYVLTEDLPPYWYHTCADSLVIHIDSTNASSNSNLLGSNFIPNVHDFAIKASGTPAETNWGQRVWAEYTNRGTIIEGGMVCFIIDSPFTFKNSFPAVDSVFGSTYFWKFDSLLPTEKRKIRIGLDIPADPQLIGKSYTHRLSVEAVAGDSMPANNFYNYADIIVGGVDPNQKTMKIENPNALGVLTDSSKIFYQIDFQNTGNYLTRNVMVVDTLDSNLDISTLEILVCSHPYDIKLSEPNVLTWTFNEIMLPDSGSDEAGSHGHISYSINPIKNLLPGTAVSNTAHIYFDFNPAVVTNTVTTYHESFPVTSIHVVSDAETQTLLTAPNPFNTTARVYLRNPVSESVQLVCFDVTGREVTRKNYANSADIIWERNELQAGIYFLSLTQQGKLIAVGKAIIQ